MTVPPAGSGGIPTPVSQSNPGVLKEICRVLVPSEAPVANGHPSYTIYGSRTVFVAVRPGTDFLYSTIGPKVPASSVPGVDDVAGWSGSGSVVVTSS